MKKFLFIIFLILIFSNCSFAEDFAGSSENFVQDVIFRSSLTNVIPDVNESSYSGYNDYSFDSRERSYKEIDPDNMPVFKQLRLMVTDRILNAGNKDNSEPKASFFKNLKFRNKEKGDTDIEQDTSITESGSDLTNSIRSEVSPDISDETLPLEGRINTQVTEKQLTLDADNVDFDEKTGDMIATGRPVLVIPPQKVKIIADKMIYNEESNILKGIGNVIVFKDGMPTMGDYLEIDMNEETMIMDNIDSHTISMDMDAKKAIQKDGLLIFHEGNFHSDKSEIYRLYSNMIGPRFYNMMVAEEDQSLFFGDPTGNKITLDIENLYVDAGKNHDVIKAKNIKVYRKDKYLFKWPSITAYTNKERDYFEASYPEFGSKRKVGMFIGPGFVFGGPFSSVIKVVPFLNYNHRIGVGGALKYLNTYNRTELGYGSSNSIFFLKGLQRLDDNLFLQYSANTYMDEWFLGSRMPKYMAEVYYDKRFVNKNFLAEGMDLQFRHRFGFGIMEDNDKNFYGEKINSSGTTTTRLRYMAEIQQSFYHYQDKEKRIAFDVSLAMQGSAAVYGTGDTQFIGRVGPRVHLQYKNWMQDIGYYISGYSDNTPIPRYDKYRYGHQSVYISEAIRLCKYLSVGWAGNLNLSDDSPNGKLFQENAFLVSIGPDDLKITLGYDFIRQSTYFGFNLAFDTKGTNVNYGKMEIKNPERLGKHQNPEERKLSFAPAKPQPETRPVSFFNPKPAEPPAAVLQYATVIDIEDPDRETVQ